MTLGQDYRLIANQLIKSYLKENELYSTLYAFELETETEEHHEPVATSLLGLIDAHYIQLQKPDISSQLDLLQLTDHVLEFEDHALPLSVSEKITCLTAFNLDAYDGMSLDKTTLILAGGTDRVLYLVRSDSGETLQSFHHHGSPILSVSSYPLDPFYAISTAMDGSCVLFDMNGKELCVFKDHLKYVHRSAFTVDGMWFVTASYDKTVRCYKRTHKEPLSFEFQNGLSFPGIVESLCVCNSTVVIGIHGDCNLHLHDLETKKMDLLNMNENGDQWVSFIPFDLQVSPNGTFLAVYTDSKAGRVIIYNLKTKELVKNFWDLNVDEFTKPCLVWCNNSTLACSSQSSITVFGMDSSIKKLNGHSDAVRALAVDVNGDLVSGSFDGTARVWKKKL